MCRRLSLSVISVQMCSSNCFDKTCLWLVFSATFCWLIESCEHTTVYQCQHRHYQIPTSIRYGMILYLLLSNIYTLSASQFIICFFAFPPWLALSSFSLCHYSSVYFCVSTLLTALPVCQRRTGLLATQKEKSAKKYLRTQSASGLMAIPHWYPPEAPDHCRIRKQNCCMQMCWELSATLHLPLNSLFVN